MNNFNDTPKFVRKCQVAHTVVCYNNGHVQLSNSHVSFSTFFSVKKYFLISKRKSFKKTEENSHEIPIEAVRIKSVSYSYNLLVSEEKLIFVKFYQKILYLSKELSLC